MHLTADAALAFVAENGIVLEAARGRRPSFVGAVIGDHRGSWWSHPQARQVFWLTRAIRESPDVLVCRLIDGKITYVHRRLWPALVRLADRLPPAALTKIREIHTPSGKHVIEETPFPDWVPAAILAAATRLDEAAAVAAVGGHLDELRTAATRRRTRRSRRTPQRKP